MSEVQINLATTASAPAQPWLQQVWRRAIAQRLARLGVIWILIVAFCALFAPLLANSHPLLMKSGGEWSSPMVRYLTRADVILLALGVLGTPLLFLTRWPLKQRFLIVLGIVAVSAVFAAIFVHTPKLVVYERYRQAEAQGQIEQVIRAPIPFSPSDRQRDLSYDAPAFPWSPSRTHWMGTDVNGQDIASNMIHACRIAMAVGFISTGIAVIIGIIVGGLMGYFSGLVDLLGMRFVEIFAAIPTIYLLLTFVAYYERDIYLIMAIIGATSWVGDARFVRAEFLKLRNQDFVQAAIAAGLPLPRVLFRHILPNAVAPLLVSVSFGVAGAIMAESTLSFLGLGLVDEASWGRLLDMARGEGGGFHWWIATFPGLAIFLTVLSYNFIGEALRDALDPKLYGGRG